MQHLRLVRIFVGLVLAFTSLLNAQSSFKYSYMPKKVYKNQLFPVTIMSSGQSSGVSVEFTFEDDSDVKPLFAEPVGEIHNGQRKGA